jgi:hypothetical protein
MQIIIVFLFVIWYRFSYLMFVITNLPLLRYQDNGSNKFELNVLPRIFELIINSLYSNSSLDELISQTTEKKFVNSWQKKFIYSSYNGSNKFELNVLPRIFELIINSLYSNSTLDELISQTTEKKFVNSWQKKFIYSSYKW